jgi:quercetin dioxygenase-like cupin family protein
VSVSARDCRPPVEVAATKPFVGTSGVPLTAEALDDIAAGLARTERRVPAWPESERSTPRSIRLIATAAYEAWLTTWPPDSEIGHHDHADATSVTRLVSGSLIESAGSGHWVLHLGASVVTASYTTHALWNASSTEATSLHVYSPPLTSVASLRLFGRTAPRA